MRHWTDVDRDSQTGWSVSGTHSWIKISHLLADWLIFLHMKIAENVLNSCFANWPNLPILSIVTLNVKGLMNRLAVKPVMTKANKFKTKTWVVVALLNLSSVFKNIPKPLIIRIIRKDSIFKITCENIPCINERWCHNYVINLKSI